MIASRRLAIVVGALTFALVAAMAASACDAIERLDSRANETAAIERAASAFVVQAGTVGPASTDRYATALLPFATGPLRDALQATVTDSRAGMLARRAAVRVERTALTALSRGTGVVTVVAVQSRQWSDARAGIQHDAVRLWLACRLEAVDGRWLVRELRVLAEEPVDPATAGSAFVD